MRATATITAIAAALFCLLGATAHAAENQKIHRLALHVDVNDPAVMNLALNNAENAIEHYKARGEEVQVEIVAYGPGLHMLRSDTSPVKERVSRMKEQNVAFSACGNTKTAMEKRESQPVEIVPEAVIVPAGVVRLMELQEQGWSYVRP